MSLAVAEFLFAVIVLSVWRVFRGYTMPHGVISSAGTDVRFTDHLSQSKLLIGVFTGHLACLVRWAVFGTELVTVNHHSLQCICVLSSDPSPTTSTGQPS